MTGTGPRLAAAVSLLISAAIAPADTRAQIAAATTAELVVQSGHQQQVGIAVFSTDSRLLASADIRGSMRLWETATGKQLVAMSGHTQRVEALQFNRDDRWLASAGGPFGGDAEVKVWDVATGRERRSLVSRGSRGVSDLAISADGTLVALAADGHVRVWNVSTGEAIAELATNDSRATLAFSPRDTLLAIRETNRLTFWSPSQPAAAPIPLRNFFGKRGMVFVSDGATLAVPDGEAVLIVDVTKRAIAGRIDASHGARVFSQAGSSDRLVIRTNRYSIWDTVRRRQVSEMPRRVIKSDEVPSPSWRWMAVPNEPAIGSMRLEDLTGGRDPLLLAGRVPVAGAVAFSPDGSLLATKTGARFWVWDLRTGQPRLFNARGNERGEMDMLAFTADGKGVIAADRLFTIAQWDLASGRVANSAPLTYDKSTNTHACSAGSRWCASGQSGRVDIRDLGSWLVYRTFATGIVRGLAVSDDGNWVAAASAEVDVWDRRNGSHRQFAGHQGEASRVGFSPAGRLLATATFSGDMKVWDVASGREIRNFQSGHRGVTSVAFSPDGRLLATGGSEETVRIWEAESGRLLHTLTGHVDWVANLAFNPDGRFLASGSADGTVRLWNAATGAAVALLTATRDTEDWLVVTPDGLFDGSAVATETLVAWRIGAAAYPPERYFDNFRPGLLATLWRGGADAAGLTPERVTAPPVVRILETGGKVSRQARLSLRVQVEGEAAEVSLYHNGARAANQPGAPGSGATYTFDLDLIPGDNELRAVATGPSGVSSNPDSIRMVYDTPAPPKPKLFVLAVGISRYQQPNWNLGFARADAEAMARFFTDRGAKLFDDVTVTVLFDEQATRTNIQRALAAIGERARPEDVVLTYFAGHGLAVDKTYYLLTHEMRDEVSLEQDVRKFGLSDRALLDSLRTIRALKKIVILDACESGNALDILGRAPPAERAALEMLARAEGLFIIAASTRQQEALEIPELGHGLLTYALLSGLGAKDDNAVPSIITMHQLLGYVSQKVPELAARYGRSTRQVPVTFHRGMDFPLALR